MKLSALSALLLSFASFAAGECESMMEMDIGDLTKLSFVGFAPTVKRMTGTGMGNKIVLKGYSKKPMVSDDGGMVTVSAGDSCEPEEMMPSTTPVVDDTAAPTAASTSSAARLALPSLFAFVGGRSAVSYALLLLTGAAVANANEVAITEERNLQDCALDPIEVEIYVDATVDELVMREAQSGQFEVCPPESLYWKHHPDVYGGYEGCVGEKVFYPCAQDSEGVWEEGGALAAKYPINWDGSECITTGYDTSNRTFWILWGDPLDKTELTLRTGLNPVVTFPFNRGPYPRYEQGLELSEAYDDSADGLAAAKDILVYIEAFTAAELEDYSVTMTQGAESGMAILWAAKALEIAQTTCNRDIYALMEGPAYGYSPSDAAALANKHAGSFYNSSECLCYADDSCKEPTITISNRGWMPLTDFPVELGGDNNTYAANSDSPASPWFESMVFPENPSGKIKTPQLSDPNRRVCDGVYVWPMYFGMEGYKIPVDKRPDCSGWSFSITKAYSASVRAGYVMYKKEPAVNHAAVVDIVSELYSMTYGSFSEWMWHGQLQLWEMIMSKPLDDPTSWIGAYSEIMSEKWTMIEEAFADCPVLTLTNPHAGAYAFFKYEPEFLGLQEGEFISTFFRMVLGIRTTTYYWGFRGANPGDFYGEEYGTYDFTRLQLYRDINVYEEVARRASLVCGDMDAVIGDFMSVNQWKEARLSRRRHLAEGNSLDTIEDHKRHLAESVPSLTASQIDYHAQGEMEAARLHEASEGCAPHYTTTCLFNEVGQRFSDF